MPPTKEILHDYVDQLDDNQQESLLTFLKSIVPLTGRISIEQYNKELADAELKIEQGHFTTQEALEEEIKNW